MSTQWIRLERPNHDYLYVKPYTIQKVAVENGQIFVTYLDAGQTTVSTMHTITPIEDILLLNDDLL